MRNMAQQETYGIPKPDLSAFNNNANYGNLFQGLQTSLAGGALGIAGMKSAAKSVLEAANFNSYIQTVNMRRNVDALARQGQRLFSAQQAAIGASGFSHGSKSFLMVANETFNEVQTKTNEIRYDFYQQDASALFEAKQQNRSFRMQAMTKSVESLMSAIRAGGHLTKSATVKF